MHAGGFHSLKLLLVFAVVTSTSVLVAVLLHRTGRASTPEMGPKAEAASVLPVPREAMRPIIGAALAAPKIEDVRKAIPLPIAEPEASPPPAKPDKIVLASLTTPNQPEQPFADQKIPTPVAEEALDALPLPPVYHAVLQQDLDWLHELLASGLSPNTATAAGDTPLCAAVQGGFVEGVEMLLTYGADPSTPGRDGQPPLALASLRRCLPILEALLRSKADPNVVFLTPVLPEILDQINSADLKYSLRSDTGVTALMVCAGRGDVESTVALMRHGAKTNAHTKKHSRYAINFAAAQRYLFVMRILLGRPPDAEPDLLVTIDLSQQRAWIEKDGQVIDSTTVSTGRSGYGTPSGRYVVTDKHRSWTSTLYHVAMPWFMRLNCSAIGMHSGYVTGRPASHGCIRLPYNTAKKWFGIVKVGDEVQIVH